MARGGRPSLCKTPWDGRTYNLLTASEVTAIVDGDVNNLHAKYHIMVEQMVNGDWKHITEFCRCYFIFQYPLLFVHGEEGQPISIHISIVSKMPNLILRDFLASRIEDTENEDHQLTLRKTSLLLSLLILEEILYMVDFMFRFKS